MFSDAIQQAGNQKILARLSLPRGDKDSRSARKAGVLFGSRKEGITKAVTALSAGKFVAATNSGAVIPVRDQAGG